jgi:hypothetical protein
VRKALRAPLALREPCAQRRASVPFGVRQGGPRGVAAAEVSRSAIERPRASLEGAFRFAGAGARKCPCRPVRPSAVAAKIIAF